MIDTLSTGVVRRYGEEEEVMLIYYRISAHYAIQVFDYLISLDPLSSVFSCLQAQDLVLGRRTRAGELSNPKQLTLVYTRRQSSYFSHTHSQQHLPKDNLPNSQHPQISLIHNFHVLCACMFVCVCVCARVEHIDISVTSHSLISLVFGLIIIVTQAILVHISGHH